ncbi:hypothetical protein [Rhodopseudomonas sp.]|nr:hypothetical protein [Rhodopseudomonas sp.]
MANKTSAQTAARPAIRDLDARKAVCAALTLAIVAVAIRIAMLW